MNKAIRILLAIALATSISFIGCSTTSSKTVSTLTGGISNEAGRFEVIRTPAKDFNTLGLVFAEATKNTDDAGVRGDVLIYQALLKEAQKLNADYIINVVIDKRVESTMSTSTTSSPLSSSSSSTGMTGKETWYGSAVAIKYTTTLTRQEVNQNTAGNSTTTTTTTSPIMNEAGASNTGGGSSSGLFSIR